MKAAGGEQEQEEEEEERQPKPAMAPDIEAEVLRGKLASLQRKHHFTVGMIVRQKPDCFAFRRFGENDRAIVVEIIDAPVLNDQISCDAPHFRDRFDLVVGSLNRGDPTDLLLYHVDSRYFEPAPEQEVKPGKPR